MLSVIVLSFNRRGALLRTLGELRDLGFPGDAGEVIVVENASTDGTQEGVRSSHPGVALIELPVNVGVAGFNRGAEQARGETLLILDDDAWPERGALEGAVQLLARDPSVGAVSLLPRHPATCAGEWPHADVPRGRWPFMGCGLLVRAEAWRRVGGYEEGFFLYRNDTDLALKLLGAGYDVRFDPAWVVWHDSAAAGRKPDRWLHLATRNWAWMVRRHGRGLWKPAGVALGWAWAIKLAGWSVVRQRLVLRGIGEGLFRAAPALPACVHPDGTGFADLLRVRLGRRPAAPVIQPGASIASSVRHSA